MNGYVIGFLIGALFAAGVSYAQNSGMTPPAALYYGVPMAPLGAPYPPALQSLPPMPTPHWQPVHPC